MAPSCVETHSFIGATEEALDKEQRSAYDLFRERMQEAELLGESFVAELWTWVCG